MNVKLFKKLIKDAVTEALHEELPEIINEVIDKREKQLLKENRTVSLTSNDVMHTPLPGSVRQQLSTKIGASLGLMPQAQTPKLEIIDSVDETTGEPVNPYLAFIHDAAANMTPQERAGLKNLG